MFKLKKLDWDSDFFNIEVAEMQLLNHDSDNINDPALKSLDLIVLKDKAHNLIQLNKFKNAFNEVKITFIKVLKEHAPTVDNSILDTDNVPVTPEDFFDLAFESGKHSRFKLDPNFKKHYFENLYKVWVKNSLNKRFADKVFYLKQDNQIAGFITVKLHVDHGSVGLIAISNKHQGRGLGKLLLERAENFSLSNHKGYLKIPTQKKNVQACKFYHKNGYTIDEQLYITHFWKLNNDPI